ncbi:AEC family transporter [Clostridium sp. DL1XJH146]
MLDNLIFSISIVMPIFLVMCMGYILKEKKIINDNFIKTANIIIFNVALPIKLFNDVSKSSFDEYFDAVFISFVIVGLLISVIVIWLIGIFFIKDKSQLGAFIHGSYRGNFLYVGLSFMENITGTIGLKTPLIIALAVPLVNVLAVIILTFTDVSTEAKVSIKDTLKSAFINIVKNPMIIAIFLGIVVSIIGIELPLILTSTMSYFKAVVTPLALITIGASFNLRNSVGSLAAALLASSIKLVIMPLVAVVLAISIGFSNEDIVLIYLFFGVPSAAVSYIMTAAMNGDKDLSANIIMTTTILSVLTMTVFIFFFKTVGIV